MVVLQAGRMDTAVALEPVIREFRPAPGYVNAATMGLPPQG